MAAKQLDGLEQAVVDFVGSFWGVFGNDWEMTKGCLDCGPDMDLYIAKGHTFLDPGVDDESNNWGNRGGLLATYRRLLKEMKKAGLPHEEPFFELEEASAQD